MNEEQKKFREQMEVRIIALLLGEASAFETAEIEEAMQKDPELAAFHAEMRRTIDLTREASKEFQVPAQAAEQRRLSPERREAILAKFKEKKVVTVPLRARASTRPRLWLIPVSLAAAIAILALVLILPKLASNKQAARYLAIAVKEGPSSTRKETSGVRTLWGEEHDTASFMLRPNLQSPPVAASTVVVQDRKSVVPAEPAIAELGRQAKMLPQLAKKPETELTTVQNPPAKVYLPQSQGQVDTAGHTVRLWGANTGSPVSESPQGAVAAGEEPKALLWNARTGKPLTPPSQAANSGNLIVQSEKPAGQPGQAVAGQSEFLIEREGPESRPAANKAPEQLSLGFDISGPVVAGKDLKALAVADQPADGSLFSRAGDRFPITLEQQIRNGADQPAPEFSKSLGLSQPKFNTAGADQPGTLIKSQIGQAKSDVESAEAKNSITVAVEESSRATPLAGIALPSTENSPSPASRPVASPVVTGGRFVTEGLAMSEGDKKLAVPPTSSAPGNPAGGQPGQLAANGPAPAFGRDINAFSFQDEEGKRRSGRLRGFGGGGLGGGGGIGFGEAPSPATKPAIRESDSDALSDDSALFTYAAGATTPKLDAAIRSSNLATEYFHFNSDWAGQAGGVADAKQKPQSANTWNFAAGNDQTPKTPQLGDRPTIGTLFAESAAPKALPELTSNPYQGITERNPFGLKPPPPPLEAPATPQQQQEPRGTGLSTTPGLQASASARGDTPAASTSSLSKELSGKAPAPHGITLPAGGVPATPLAIAPTSPVQLGDQINVGQTDFGAVNGSIKAKEVVRESKDLLAAVDVTTALGVPPVLDPAKPQQYGITVSETAPASSGVQPMDNRPRISKADPVTNEKERAARLDALAQGGAKPATEPARRLAEPGKTAQNDRFYRMKLGDDSSPNQDRAGVRKEVEDRLAQVDESRDLLRTDQKNVEEDAKKKQSTYTGVVMVPQVLNKVEDITPPTNVKPPPHSSPITTAGASDVFSVDVVGNINPARTNLVNGNNMRESIVSKLAGIRLDQFQADGLPLGEVIKRLDDEAKKHDRDQVGVNFLLNANLDPAAAAPAIDPSTGLPATAASEQADLSATTIKIMPPLRNVTLLQALDAVAKVADRPIKYSVEDAAVVFSLKDKPKSETKEDPAPPKTAPVAPPTPQPEINTRENAFSTFSLNVSDVSFKLAAASLQNNVLPDPASVRVEEFVNAFNYHDPAPQSGARLAFAWERAHYPFAHNRDILRFSIQTAARGREAHKPLNLVILLDNSGSMERADRVQTVREAMKVLAQQLQPQDRISVIAFARTPHLWVDGMAGGKPKEFLDKVLDLNPDGGTNLEDALGLGYATAARHFVANGNNRVILLTDGAANLGNVEPEALKQKVVSNRIKGIALDCFGIGWEGYNDDLLEVLSHNGDGRYGFLNQPEEAGPEFANQLAGALNVEAADVKTQVEFNPNRVISWRQIGYAKHQLTKEQFRDNKVDAAELAASESGNALYAVEVNPEGNGPIGVVRVRYKVPSTGEYVEHSWTIPHQATAPALDQSSPAMRLAVTAAAFGEWLSRSPYAGEIMPGTLQPYLNTVCDTYSPDSRPQRLVTMIRQAQMLAGK